MDNMSPEISSERGFEKIREYERETNRIQKTLEGLLDKEAARELTAKIYEIALDIDEAIGGLLEDPGVLKKYNYDGDFFEPKNGGEFYKACNGLNFLRKAVSDENLRCFFKSASDQGGAIGETLRWLREYLWIARARLLNWREGGSVGLISKEILEQLVKEYEAQQEEQWKEKEPLSSFPEESSFFETYEREMDKFLRG